MTVETDSLRGESSLAESLKRVCGDALLAVLFYGSRLTNTAPDRYSAYDLILVVTDYGSFYRRLRDAGRSRRAPLLLSLLNRWLPPNVISYPLDGRDGPLAKCLVLSATHFRRALRDWPRDHFCLARLVQQTELLLARDAGAAQLVSEGLAGARMSPLWWAAPSTDPPFTAEDLCRRMLEVSYGAELRPESGDRIQAVFEAQRDFLREAYDQVLEQGARSGILAREEGGYRLARVPGAWQRLRLRAYFFRSKVRTTARWLKHMVTFEDWLDYIVRKVERRTAMSLEITPWERRLPLLFLWPKTIRVLRWAAGRDSRGSDEGGPPPNSRNPVPRARSAGRKSPRSRAESPQHRDRP